LIFSGCGGCCGPFLGSGLELVSMVIVFCSVCVQSIFLFRFFSFFFFFFFVIIAFFSGML
jgi:hypothetical protein